MIQIAKNAELTDLLSTGDGSNPLETTHDATGQSVEIQVHLFNDDETVRYEEVIVTVVDNDGATDESGWIQFSPDGVSYGPDLIANTLNVPNSGLPFWVKITNTARGSAEIIEDLDIRVTAKEFAV